VTLPADARRDAAIDMAKGCAILWVLLIHSDALHQNALFRNLVNHAVPVFVVLFGLNSSLWWRRRSLRRDLAAWYRGRARRILVPMWAMLPVWWALALYFRPFGVRLSWRLPVVQAAGYLLYVGTGWFITMILQLVLVFPLFEAAARRLGMSVVLAAGLACTALTLHEAMRMVDAWGLFNYWIFSPRFFGHVAFGMLLARHRQRLAGGAFAVAALVFAAGVIGQEATLGSRWTPWMFAVEDLALTVLLLTGLRPLARVPLLGPALAWLGVSSYGIYVGQMITHNAFVYRFGLGDLFVRLNLWVYTAVLLGGGLFFVAVGEMLLRMLDGVRTWLTPAEAVR
jgi:peptidoglycan/LPS O-acetylase OafA/YrhL